MKRAVLSLLTALALGFSLVHGQHQSCPCGAANIVEIRGKDPTPKALATIPAGGAGLEIQADGLVKFAEADDWRKLFNVLKVGAKGGKLASGLGARLGVACPKCEIGFAAAESGLGVLDLFLGSTGSEKVGDAMGRDPKRGDGYGSKKGGGVLIILPGASYVTGRECPCTHDRNGVFHLVANGQSRFQKYAPEHSYRTPSQLASMSIRSGQVRVVVWDKYNSAADYRDNSGDYVLTARVRHR